MKKKKKEEEETNLHYYTSKAITIGLTEKTRATTKTGHAFINGFSGEVSESDLVIVTHKASGGWAQSSLPLPIYYSYLQFLLLHKTQLLFYQRKFKALCHPHSHFSILKPNFTPQNAEPNFLLQMKNLC